MKSLLFPALLLFSIKSANAAPTNGGSPGNVATDSPCPVLQGAELLGCQLKSDCLSGGPGRAYLESKVCGGSPKCCYNNIPCVNSPGNICMNYGDTSCIGGEWEGTNCAAGAGGNLQCCNIPRVTSFHSTNEQANLEYFKTASVPDLSFPLLLGSNLEQQQPSEEGSSDDGSNLHSPAQPITGNNLIGFYGPQAGGSDPWAEAWE